MAIIREVWRSNLDSELFLFKTCIQSFHVISLDTEFPGMLRKTPRYAEADQLYTDMKYNVDHLQVIQVGMTFSRGLEEPFATFQFNFSDFDYEKHPHDPESLHLLRTNGVNLDRTRREGIPVKEFQSKIMGIFSEHYRNLSWITFHGVYDFAYVLKLLNGNEKLLPNTLFEFSQVCAEVFPKMYDLKYMARHVQGLLGGELGLMKLANILKIQRVGSPHQAGSDSLLIAGAFSKMMNTYHLPNDLCQGFLYGINFRIENVRASHEQMLQQQWQRVPYFYPIPLMAPPNPFAAPAGYYYHPIPFPSTIIDPMVPYVFVHVGDWIVPVRMNFNSGTSG